MPCYTSATRLESTIIQNDLGTSDGDWIAHPEWALLGWVSAHSVQYWYICSDWAGISHWDMAIDCSYSVIMTVGFS